jgi:membrane protease YdiL (CAAX protease family)
MTARAASTPANHVTQTSRLSTVVALALVLAAKAFAREAFLRLGLGAFAGSLAILVAGAMATALLVRTGESWQSIGLRRPVRYRPTLAWGLGAAVVIIVFLPLVLGPLANELGWPPQHTDRLGDLRNPWRYFIFLVPIGWGTAAFGEELVYRGFIYTRILLLIGESRLGRLLAGLCQAALFGLAHLYLGPRGALNGFAIGLTSVVVYELSGRNLWPVVLAHGLVDTIGLTALHFGVTDS